MNISAEEVRAELDEIENLCFTPDRPQRRLMIALVRAILLVADELNGIRYDGIPVREQK